MANMAHFDCTHHDIFAERISMPILEPVFPTGPLNLNPDGTKINLKRSHSGPNAAILARADAEEFERLFNSDTIKPINFTHIPRNKVVTHVNPVCGEKLNDDGSLKPRTRITIGGDRLEYPFNKSAETAEMEAVKF
jgi:hypothetical protein